VRNLLVGLVAATSFAAGPTWAADVVWVDGTGSWFDPGNWVDINMAPDDPNRFRVPGSSDVAYVDNGGTALVTSGSAHSHMLRFGAGGSGGSMVQTGGMNNVGLAMHVGLSAGKSGSYTLDDGSVYVGNWEDIGVYGTGTFVQNGGTNTTGEDLSIARFAGSSGTYDKYAGTINATGDGMTVGFGGNGSFTQHAGDTTVDQDFNIGHEAVADGTVVLHDGNLSVGRYQQIGLYGKGTFLQTGGTNEVGKHLQIAIYPGSHGEYELHAGDLAVAELESVGMAGTGKFIQYGGGNSAAAMLLGTSAGGDGRYEMFGGTTAIETSIHVGHGALGLGRIVLHDGSLSVAMYEQIGFWGEGHFRQEGGTNEIGEQLQIATHPGSHGEYELRAGDLIIANHEHIGMAGTGRFTQYGGTNSASGLYLGHLLGGDGSYELMDGTVEVGLEGLTIGNTGTGEFWQGGGECRVDEHLAVARSPGSCGGLILEGGSLRVSGSAYVGGGPDASGGLGVLSIAGAGQLTVAHNLHVWQSGEFRVQGGTMESAVVDVEGTVSVLGSAVEIAISDSLIFRDTAVLTAVSGAKIRMEGASFRNESTSTVSLSGLANLELVFAGGSVASPLTLEAAGRVDDGFSNNFSLGKLSLPAGDGVVQLVDSFNNGRRDMDRKEHLFVDEVEIGAGRALDLNGLGLYAREDEQTRDNLNQWIDANMLRDTTLAEDVRLRAVFDSRKYVSPGTQPRWTVVAREDSLSGIPAYEWRRGCSPTSAAMLMAYWDQNGYPNLWAGTPPTSNDPGNDADPVNVVIENIGDLMGTDPAAQGGGTSPWRIPTAMRQYAKNRGRSYKFKAENKYASDRHPGSWFEGFSFNFLKKEIDAGRPMHVGLKGGQNGPAPWGHSVVAYGYQDSPGSDNDWVAVMDTWTAGDSNGTGGIIAKVEGGIEWWKWVIDTTQDYYIYRGCYFIPAREEHAVWGLFESSFTSAIAFEEQFEVTGGVSGSADMVTLAGEPEQSCLEIRAEGISGNDDTLVTSETSVSDTIWVSLKYAFETPGMLQILLDGQLLGELVDPVGRGPVDEESDFQLFAQAFDISDYGLHSTESYELTFRLLAGSEHTIFLDDVQVIDPDAAPVSGVVIPGDSNGDFKVNELDYDNLIGEFGMTDPPDTLTADFNGDGVVDIEDFAIMRAYFGFGIGVPSSDEFQATTTPEPATVLMLALGGLLVVRRRRRRS